MIDPRYMIEATLLVLAKMEEHCFLKPGVKNISHGNCFVTSEKSGGKQIQEIAQRIKDCERHNPPFSVTKQPNNCSYEFK